MAIGFLEIEEMSFISAYLLNSLMYRGEKSQSWLSQANFAFTNTGSIEEKGWPLFSGKIFDTCYSVTAGVLMLAFKTEILLSFLLALMMTFYLVLGIESSVPPQNFTLFF